MKPSEQTRIVAGKYGLEKLLGQGGMGEVWVATEIATGRKIALKLLKSAAADSKENRARFEREARIARTLVSPHIAQVTDSGVDEDGDPFMALELLHGEDLQKRIKTEKALPLDKVVRLAIQVGRALHVAHSAGLVHRDLKPANIFLARQGDDEVVKVLDFGIAKTGELDNTQYTAAGAMLGTASYMSPEQIRNAKTVDHRADLWAFAVVLFRALTGELPFTLTGFELFLALAQDPIPTPQKVTALVPGLPAPLNVFFERSFVRDLDTRYPSASAMVVGFCRAAGVTVPPDILSTADAPMPPPTSGSRHSDPRISNLPGSSGQFPAVAAPPSSGPISPGPASPGPAVHEGAQGLAGTMMLDVAPSEPPVAANLMSRPGPAAGRAADAVEIEELDPDEPDNAATLFYQPPIKDLPAGPPPASPPPPDAGAPASAGFSGGPQKQAVFTYPLEAARAAAAAAELNAADAAAGGGAPAGSGASSGSQAPTMLGKHLQQASYAVQTGGWQRMAAPAKRSFVWLWIVIGILVLLGAGAVLFFVRE